MNQLKIAGNSIGGTTFGHLQIIYGDGTSDLEIEVQAPQDVTNPFSGLWNVVPIRDHSTTPFFGNSFYYDVAVVPLAAGQTALGVWTVLQSIHEQFLDRYDDVLDYNIKQNSNSYVHTLMDVVGIDISDFQADYTPIVGFLGGFPGSNRNVLTDKVGSGPLLYLNLTGSDEVDHFFTGDGDDTLEGAGGKDILVGGEGDDNFIEFLEEELGGFDDDDPIGPEPFSPDQLEDLIDGGADFDTLSYEYNNINVRVGTFDGHDALVISAPGATDVAFNIERLVGKEGGENTIDFSGFDKGINFDGDTATVTFDGKTLELQNFGHIEGSNGSDILNGSTEFKRLYGGAGDDTLNGAGNGSLYGGNGSDILIGGVGDNLNGGAGNDRLDSGGGGVFIRAGSGADTISALIGDVIADVDANDTLSVNGVDITGNGIFYNITANYLLGTDKADEMFSKSVVVFVRPELIQSEFDGTQASFRWIGHVMFDPTPDKFHPTIGHPLGSEFAATIHFKPGDLGLATDGYVENALVTYESVTRELNTFPIGTVTGSTITGDEDAVVTDFEEYSGVSSLDISDFLDVLQTSPVAPIADNIVSGSGNTTISNFSPPNQVIVFNGSAIDPNVSLVGIVYSQIGSDVQIDLGSGDVVTLENTNLASWQAAAATQILGTSLGETLYGSQIDDLIVGGDGNDTIYDGAGNDTVVGGAGRDTFYAGAGADSYDGGTDLDQIHYTQATSGLVIDMVDAINSTGIAAGDTFSGIENLHGSDFDDMIIANANRVFGGAGDDTIEDAAGAQRLYGGTGADTFRFIDGDGALDQIFDFELGIDVLDLSLWGVTSLDDPGLNIYERSNAQGLQGDLTVSFGDNSILIHGLDTADIANFQQDDFVFASGSTNFVGATINGTASADLIDASYVDIDGERISEGGQTILAGDGNDTIYDGAGNDTVVGGAGRDTFYAGAGADSYDGGTDLDQIHYTQATSGLVIDMVDAINSTGIAAGDTFSGIENLHGSDFDDMIIANANRVFGGAGDDTIEDAAGAQRLYGGTGADTFRFIDGDGALDQIFDFELGIDVLDLSLWGVTSLDDPGLNIYERSNAQGLQGDLTVSFGDNSILIHGLDTADIANFQQDDFVFA